MIYNIYLNIIVKVFILAIYILTGSIGSGKSEAQILFEKFNVSCFCADKIVKGLYKNSEVILGMQNILPLCVKDGVINIELLRETIFHNQKKMFEVEEFIQPKVFKKFEEIVNSNEKKNIILIIPTIKNNSFKKKYKVIYITASQENRVKRLSSRENYNIQLIKKIISYQDSVDIYKKNNDFFLDNNGSVKNLENSIRKLVKLL